MKCRIFTFRKCCFEIPYKWSKAVQISAICSEGLHFQGGLYNPLEPELCLTRDVFQMAVMQIWAQREVYAGKCSQLEKEILKIKECKAFKREEDIQINSEIIIKILEFPTGITY